MLFSDVVAEVKNGSWVLNEKSPLVYQIVKPKVTIQFFPEKTKMLIVKQILKTVFINRWQLKLEFPNTFLQ